MPPFQIPRINTSKKSTPFLQRFQQSLDQSKGVARQSRVDGPIQAPFAKPGQNAAADSTVSKSPPPRPPSGPSTPIPPPQTFTTPSGATGTIDQLNALGNQRPTSPSPQPFAANTPQQPAPTPQQAQAPVVDPQIAALRARVLGGFEQSQQERDIAERLARITGSLEPGLAGLEGQGRGITLPFITGQQAALRRQTAAEASPLTAQLGAIQAGRLGEQQRAEAELGFAQGDVETRQGFESDQATAQRQQAITDLVNQGVTDAATIAGALGIPPTEVADTLTALGIQGEGALDTQIVQSGGRVLLVNSQTGETIQDFGASEGSLKRAQDVQKSLGGSNVGISPITGKAFNDSQSKAGTFALRMEQSNADLDSKEFVDAALFGLQFLKGNERRAFEQAEQNFITAQLRRESGAAIADSEFVTARQIYVPQFGDDEEVLKRKAKARQIAIQGMKNESVGAFDQLKESIDALDEEVDQGTSGVTSSGLKYTIEE